MAARGSAIRSATIAVAAASLVACDRAPPAPVASAALPPGAVARVGSIVITADLVARIAAAQRTSIEEARDAAVRDALFAQAALDRGLAQTREVDRQITAELARVMLHRVLAEARKAPPTEDELAAAAKRRWLDVDRPEGSRVVHAVVRCDPQKDDDAKKASARAVAEAIRAAALPISERASTMPLPEGAPLPSVRQRPSDDPDPLSAAFRKAAALVPSRGLEVTIEPLPAAAADGRVLAPNGGNLDTIFTRAAAAIPARGGLSPIVETNYGYHVILLLERTPAQVLQGEARTARLLADIVNERARAADKQLLARLRPGSGASPDARGLIELPRVEP
jgi:hypothetical protein